MREEQHSPERAAHVLVRAVKVPVRPRRGMQAIFTTDDGVPSGGAAGGRRRGVPAPIGVEGTVGGLWGTFRERAKSRSSTFGRPVGAAARDHPVCSVAITSGGVDRCVPVGTEVPYLAPGWCGVATRAALAILAVVTARRQQRESGGLSDPAVACFRRRRKRASWRARYHSAWKARRYIRRLVDDRERLVRRRVRARTAGMASARFLPR